MISGVYQGATVGLIGLHRPGGCAGLTLQGDSLSATSGQSATILDFPVSRYRRPPSGGKRCGAVIDLARWRNHIVPDKETA
ncbi:hypothetical protein [Martelella mangrovi]|uniref:Uncharacterized protein n=1 Tax=Martelella mangrovi TaxID=1397477 RepID=A0ABV2IE30_9HYPH